ncbi:MAG: hypothetical protein ACKPHW_00095, partial [Microcystis panniformis]
AKERIIFEHIHRHLKIFKILSSRYRNRRKRFGLRFNLIAGIYNRTYATGTGDRYIIVFLYCNK